MTSPSRFSIALLTALALGVGHPASAQGPDGGLSASRPNVVVLVADDLGWRDAGFMGSAAAQTPNLDRLAASGLVAERAFVTTPQCSPSRVSMLTGRYAHAVRAEDLHDPLPPGAPALPDLLGEAGYVTGLLLKSHLDGHPAHETPGTPAAGRFTLRGNGPDSAAAAAFAQFLDEAAALGADGRARPFFAWVGFRDPHRSYGDAPRVTDPADVVVPRVLVDTPETRRDLADYLDEVARMDRQTGAMLAELDRRGLRERTLVLFVSDNGAPFPREKGTLYDAGVRTPLVASWPGRVPAGARTRALVSLIDLAPTILDVAGVDVPPGLPGRSLVPLLTDPTAPGRDVVFFERNWHDADEHMRGVRSDRFALVVNAYTWLPHGTPSDVGRSPSFAALLAARRTSRLTPAQALVFEAPRPAVELYDLDADPDQLANLAGDPAFTDVTDRLTGVRLSRETPPLRNDF